MSLNLTAWPAGLERCATEQVLTASAAYTDAVAKLVAGEAELTDARQAVEAAIREDDVAALRAVEQGKLPPKPTTEKASQAVVAAERNAAALRRLLDKASSEYVAAVVAAHDELRAQTAEALDQELAGIADDIDRLADRLAGVADLRLLADQLGQDDHDLQGAYVSFRPARTGRMLDRDPLDPRLRQLLTTLQEQVCEQADYQTVTF